ncbi:MAG: hypothetical protein KBD19_00895 [Candidatus Moranbacteria bacterium]|nr:hypothetical protein [Candidatus Moranbacteria bacterium]
MGLQDLNEDIYARNYEGGRKTHTEFEPGNQASGNVEFGMDRWGVSKISAPETFQSKVRDFFMTKWKWFMIGLLSLFFIVFVANLAFIRGMLFTEDRVSLEIVGPKEVASSETVEYVVRYKNENMLPMGDVELLFSYPESFRMDDSQGATVSGNSAKIVLGTVDGRSGGEARFSGKFYGSKGSLAYFKAILVFAPSGISGRFERQAQAGVTIASSPIVLEVSAPQEVASGNEVEYVFAYRNDSDLSFSNLRIQAEYPQNFRFNSSEPRSIDGDASWRLGNLLPRATGEIRVRGVITGNRDEAKVVRVSLGVLQGDDTLLSYDRKERLTRIVVSPLSITQTVNGKTDISVNPGDSLNYEIQYSNDGDIGLRDVIITVEVNAAYLDMTKLRMAGGSYDTARSVITWKAPDLPELSRLEPKKGGKVTFTTFVRSDIGVSGEAGKHLSVRTIAKIDSPDIPFSNPSNKVIASNALETRIGSTVDYQVSGYHFDTALPNAGSIPPKVGEETTYTLRFKVTNYLNDIARAKVTATLPTGVRYTGKKIPESEPISYNERTGHLIWDIGSMWGGGKTTKEIAFQVAIVPGLNEIGTSPTILLDSVFEAEDTFTKKSIRVESGSKTTNLKDDVNLSESGFNVVP